MIWKMWGVVQEQKKLIVLCQRFARAEQTSIAITNTSVHVIRHSVLVLLTSTKLIRGLETRSTPSSFPRNERSVVLQPWRAPRPPPPLISAAPSETLPTHLSNAPCLFAAGCPGRTRKDEHTTKGGREFLFFASHQSLYSQKRQILHFDQRF